MPDHHPLILVTAANGQLGRLVVEALLDKHPADRIAVTVRRKDLAEEFATRGIRAHVADYAQPDTLDAAFEGVDRLLLISSSALGQRIEQHRNAIEAAKRAQVKLLAYTSVLHADASTLGLAAEHRQTEADLNTSAIPFALLRNGWYTENYTASIPPALAHGVFLGSAGHGRIASAARADYAAAAVAVLTASDDQAGGVYELAGDTGYTLSQFAGEVARLSGKPVVYKDLPAADYKAVLVGAGLPEPIAALLADSDLQASKGALDDRSGTLAKLIGRPTTPMAETISAALKG
ncbi:NAD(P)H-binding protein [Lichenifustis flavocetrariae]|uniref:NAD(P)H-binding protein n=1 Tax=Lichenifustis flavocetrariae TaxID=2949735 RepID=A0AA41YQ41_9HYPH|nr:NAD(P)H-binding protein [Lichenifustis flavocetrariae]MCW6506456.1 NAD(P)H-binding protein [Lichenifustis flavocetrariae]